MSFGARELSEELLAPWTDRQHHGTDAEESSGPHEECGVPHMSKKKGQTPCHRTDEQPQPLLTVKPSFNQLGRRGRRESRQMAALVLENKFNQDESAL